MMRYLPFAVFMLLAGSLALALFTQPKHMASLRRGDKIDLPLPELALDSADGKTTFQSSSLQGQFVLLNFFASWCVPCLEEQQEIIALKEEVPDLVIVGVAWNDTPPHVSRWLRAYGNPFHSLWFDHRGQSAIAFGVRGIPESFLIDPRGRLRYHLTGPLTAESREETLVPIVRALRKEHP